MLDNSVLVRCTSSTMHMWYLQYTSIYCAGTRLVTVHDMQNISTVRAVYKLNYTQAEIK